MGCDVDWPCLSMGCWKSEDECCCNITPGCCCWDVEDRCRAPYVVSGWGWGVEDMDCCNGWNSWMAFSCCSSRFSPKIWAESRIEEKNRLSSNRSKPPFMFMFFTISNKDTLQRFSFEKTCFFVKHQYEENRDIQRLWNRNSLESFEKAFDEGSHQQ